jgi:hypothetical protein
MWPMAIILGAGALAAMACERISGSGGVSVAQNDGKIWIWKRFGKIELGYPGSNTSSH